MRIRDLRNWRAAMAVSVLVSGWTCFPAGADIVAHWAMDESSGATATDSVGGRSGSLSPQGAIFVAGGVSGNALSIDSSLNGLVTVPDDAALMFAGNQPFTISLWVKTSLTGWSILASKHQSGGQNGYFLAMNYNEAGKASFYVSSDSTAVSSASVTDDQWRHIVGVYNTDGTRLIYVDGAPGQGGVAAANVVANTQPLYLGGLGGASSYTGLLDDVQIYDQALSATQVLFLFTHPGQAIPEPAGIGVLVLAAAGMLVRRRR